MFNRVAWLFTMVLVAEAMLVTGRPPRFPSTSIRDALEWSTSVERKTEMRPR